MTTHKHHDLKPVPISEEEKLDKEDLDIMHSMQESMQIQPTHLTHLRELYMTDDIDTLEQEVEDLADRMMVEDPAYLELVRERKINPKNEKEIVQKIRELSHEYVKYIYLEADIPSEGFEGEMQEASAHIDSLITDPSNQQAAYIELGITTPSREGEKVVYRFPSAIVPDAVNNKWETYIGSVYEHEKAEKELRYTDDKGKVLLKDNIRKNAHDAVTHDIERLIGSKIGLDFAATRMLLATIRDHELKSLGSLEEQPQDRKHAETLAKRQHGLLRAATILASAHETAKVD